MAQSYQTTSGNLIIPGAYPSIAVQASPGGLAASGVIILVGEADQGPDYTIEGINLKANLFGPDQGAAVAQKYKSGNLVDAFNSVVSAANDPQLTGAPSRVLMVKTNASTRATSNLPKIGGGTYGTLNDLSYGKLGNLIYWSTTTKTQETVPTTGPFHIAPPIGAVNYAFRVNGGAKVTLTSNALDKPPTIQAALNGLSGLSCTGGANRLVIQAVAGNLTVTGASGDTITVTFSGGGGAWAVTPTVGDLAFISSTSAIVGAGSANAGSYIVTTANATTLTLVKILDQTGVPGTITPPVNVGSQAVASTTADLVVYAPLVLSTVAGAATNSSNQGSAVDGIGKTIEFEDPQTNGSGEKLVNLCYVGGSATVAKVTFVSTTAAPALITSAQEYSVTLAVNRQVDNVSETINAGGQIALQMSYKGTTATVTITATTLTTSVTGGTGSNLSLTLKDYPTIADLVAYINAQPGYSAKVGTATLAAMASNALDEVTAAGICTDNNQGSVALSTLNGRIKVDAAKFWTAIYTGSSTVKLNTDPVPNPKSQVGAPSALGLPDAQNGSVATANPTYLTGGTKGGTTAAGFSAAIDALQAVVGNFVVPLFSQDASLDITAGLTESSSTYTIDAINAYVKTHVNAMSTLKRRRNRQAFLSKRDTFAVVQAAASNLAAYRCSLTFQDFKRVTAASGIVQFQPWMGAVLAAGMQAAAFYKGILKKGINCSGVLQSAGDFNDALDSNMEDALVAGLLPAKIPDDGGGFVWASDQTTYGKDNNFVYNSIQAVYVADLIALTTSQRMERMFVGQSVADISASLALTALESIMDDLRRLKLIAASDDAPRGFKNATIRISGTALVVSIEVKLAGLIYFVPISFLVTPVQQAAG